MGIRFGDGQSAELPPGGVAAYPRDHLRHPTAMECLARTLERSGGFRVLRRLDVPLTPLPDQLEGKLALLVDVETTGLDAVADEVIELAAVPFQYGADGRIVSVHEPFDQLRDPGRPIPAEVTRLTGIDDAMVGGKVLDLAALGDLASRASLVVAHNASFDRDFVERLAPVFADLPWGCSMSDVPWREEGASTLKLEVLAARAGFFYDAHRAGDDCLATVELLSRALPTTGRIAMAELLRSARRKTVRVTAAGAPFDRKGLLKARHYRWREPASGDGRKAWTIEVAAETLEAEILFLREQVYGNDVDVPVTPITAYSRYSARV